MAAAAPTAYSGNGPHGGNGARPFEPPGEAEADQGIWVCGDTPLPAQLWGTPPGSNAPGGWFGQDGVLDRVPPGPDLGLLLPGAGDLAGLGDDELTGAVRGWRRMGSWAAAMEHAAVAELVRRRIAEAESCGAEGGEVPRYAAAEVAAALTLTSCSADGLMGRAMSLAALPGTWAALAAGRIDVPKALVILNGVSCLRGDLARTVEAQVVPAAAGKTTSELRKAVAQAVIAADPAAADRRVAEAAKSARVERWAEPCGTVAVAGRDLPPADALAADNRVNALAAALKADGAPGGIDLLRAQVFLGLLLGRPVAAPGQPPTAAEHRPIPEQQPISEQQPIREQQPSPERQPSPEQSPAPGHRFTSAAGVAASARSTGPAVPTRGADPAGDGEPVAAGPQRVAAGPGQLGPPLPPPGGGWARIAGAVNLTVPLRSLLGQSGQPAEIAGFGPISPSVTGEILTV